MSYSGQVLIITGFHSGRRDMRRLSYAKISHPIFHFYQRLLHANSLGK